MNKKEEINEGNGIENKKVYKRNNHNNYRIYTKQRYPMQYIYYSPSTVFYPSIEQNGK